MLPAMFGPAAAVPPVFCDATSGIVSSQLQTAFGSSGCLYRAGTKGNLESFILCTMFIIQY
jgi:hypothetical protein